MGLFILEDSHLDHVPGTAPLADKASHQHNVSHLKHSTGGDRDIILIPQPSESPRDPLNWSLRKRDLIFLIFCANSAAITSWSYMLTSAYGVLANDFKISYGDVNGQLGWSFFILAFLCLITNALAVKFGKRPLFLAANVLLLSTSLGSIYSKSWNSFLASRLIGSMGLAPYETLVSATVSDLYFVHERGLRLGLWVLAIYASSSVAGIVSGAIFLGIVTAFLFLFCPETTYGRESKFNIDLGTVDHIKESNSQQELETDKSEEDIRRETQWTFIEKLRPWRGIESRGSLIRIIFRPVPLLLFPQVLYGFFTGLSASWLSALYGIVALIFGNAPYNLSVSHLGIMLGVGGLISTILGFATAPLSDWLCKYLARRNNGIYEPEFRLVTIIFPFLFGTIGFFGFGITLHYQLHWIIPYLFFCAVVLGLSILNIITFAYITDCLRDHSSEAFTSLTFSRAYEFGLNFLIANWYIKQGPLKVFCIIGVSHILVMSLTIPMYIYGKRARSWTARKRLFKAILAS